MSFPKSHDPRCTVCCEPSAVVDEDGRHFCGDCFLRHVMLRYGMPTETTAGLRPPDSVFELQRIA